MNGKGKEGYEEGKVQVKKAGPRGEGWGLGKKGMREN